MKLKEVEMISSYYLKPGLCWVGWVFLAFFTTGIKITSDSSIFFAPFISVIYLHLRFIMLIILSQHFMNYFSNIFQVSGF